MSRVRYILSRRGTRKMVAAGQTPTPFAASFTAKSTAITPAPDASAAAEISAPARRKKNGVSSAKEIDRSRSIRIRSWRKIPATTSPAIGRKDSLAPGLGGERAEPQEHHEEELDLRFAHPMSEPPDHEPRREGKQRERGGAYRHKNEEHHPEV